MHSHRKGLLTFSGSEDFEILFDKNGLDGKECFRLYEDGRYKNTKDDSRGLSFVIKTRHPNVLYSAIKGKKSWGLQMGEWSFGVNDWTFTKEELLNEFVKNNIEIPKPFVLDFENRIEKLRQERINKEIERLQSGGMWV